MPPKLNTIYNWLRFLLAPPKFSIYHTATRYVKVAMKNGRRNVLVGFHLSSGAFSKRTRGIDGVFTVIW